MAPQVLPAVTLVIIASSVISGLDRLDIHHQLTREALVE